MECNCGGYTQIRETVRDKALIGEYQRCVACGRVMWLWGETEVHSALAKEEERRNAKMRLM